MNLFHLIRLMALEQESFPLLVMKMGFFRQLYRLSRMFVSQGNIFLHSGNDSWGENVFVELSDLEISDRQLWKLSLVEEMQFEVAYCDTRNSGIPLHLGIPDAPFLGLSRENWTLFLVPSAQIHQNIQTLRIIYFDFDEIFGSP